MLLYSAPPGLPTVMVVIGRVGWHRLQKQKISLMFPEALGKGACADVVAFDKTGTLTHSTVSHHMQWGCIGELSTLHYSPFNTMIHPELIGTVSMQHACVC